MAFTTKLNLINEKFYQSLNGDLSLSGDTKFGVNAEYLTGMSATYNYKTIPDVDFVTGQTADLAADIQYISGKTSENIADIANLAVWSGQTNADIANLAVWSGQTNADILNLAIWSGQTNADILNLAIWSGQTNADIDYISGVTDANYAAFTGYTASTAFIIAHTITGGTNGLTCYNAHNLCLGGSLTSPVTIDTTAASFSILGVAPQLTSTATNIMIGTCPDGGCYTKMCYNQAGNLDFIHTDSGGTMSMAADSNGLCYTTDLSTCFTDNNLVTKKYVTSQVSGITANAITAAANGLTKVGQTAELGGTLTKNTTVNVSTFDLKFSGDSVQYTADYSSTYVARSLVDKGYVATVSGATLTCANAYAHAQDIIVSGATLLAANNYTDGCATCINNKITYISGVTTNKQDCIGTPIANSLTYTDASCEEAVSPYLKYYNLVPSLSFGVNQNITGGTNTDSAIIGGQDNTICNALRAVILGSQGITLSGTGWNDFTAVDCLAIMDGIGCADNLLCVNTTTGKVGYTSLSAFGGITGGTNGIVPTTFQRLALGGSLTCDTTINGAGFDLSLGAVGSKLDLFNVNTSGNLGITSDANLVMSLSGGTVATSDSKGLRYTTDYSTTFVNNSLVTKLYVDTVASGLDPKSAVLVATTGSNLDLSGTETIDGISLLGGERVLVKDQTLPAENGIYIVNSGGTWTRATDFDGTPTGEVTQGALIPVLTGSTNINSSWILITQDPITIDTTPLEFTKFSQLLDVSAGDGIRIDTVGETKEINVELASNSGLEFSGGDLKVDLADNSGLQLLSTGLTVNPAIAGNALDWSAGVINVNITDVNTQLGGVLTGSTNGLTDLNGVVCLGGTLTTPTTICGNNSQPLTINCLTNFDLGFNGTATITDASGSNPAGLQYASDTYRTTFVSTSLVDAGYVTGLTSGLDSRLNIIEPIYVTGATGGIYKSDAHTISLTAVNQAILGGALTGSTNGLTDDGRIVKLGGALTENTAITGAFTMGFSNTVINLTGSSCVNISSPSVKLTQSLPAGATTDTLVVRDSTGELQGLAVSAITSQGILTADNGLTKSGTNVSLGGTLTGDTCICTDAYKLEIGNGDTYITLYNTEDVGMGAGNSFIDVYATSTYECVMVSSNSAFVEVVGENTILSVCDTVCIGTGGGAAAKVDGINDEITLSSSKGIGVEVDGSCGSVKLCTYGISSDLIGLYTCSNFPLVAKIEICGTEPSVNITNGAGGTIGIDSSNSIQLTTDTNVTISQLPSGDTTSQYVVLWDGDVTYALTRVPVSSLVAAGSVITGATNGLNINSGKCVGLGGTLTGDTTINGSQNDLSILDAGLFRVNAGSCIYLDTCGDINICVANATPQILLTDATETVAICANNVDIYSVGASVQVTGGSVYISGATILQTVPASGDTASDSVLVRDAATGAIQQIPASSLGQDNNDYSMLVATTSTGLTTTSPYTILVNHTAPVTITLPATPFDGQAFKIKDAANDALTYNITVSGNGNDIDVTGTSTATINTDGGALELVFNTVLDKWFVMSFVN